MLSQTTFLKYHFLLTLSSGLSSYRLQCKMSVDALFRRSLKLTSYNGGSKEKSLNFFISLNKHRLEPDVLLHFIFWTLEIKYLACNELYETISIVKWMFTPNHSTRVHRNYVQQRCTIYCSITFLKYFKNKTTIYL